mmetsp:Transcript_19263/g.41971  ORF Transcript_19263/g.41971 Transcript_19263/m.41971 type:complete len:302 (-) Transcript_19263:66-971(-)
MVGQIIRDYLHSRGFAAEDIPKVLGAFVAAKYVTLGGFVVIGARYQPLSRLFVRRKALPALTAWARRQSLRLDADRHAGNIGKEEHRGGRLRRALDAAQGRYQGMQDRVFLRAREAWRAGRLKAQNRQLMQHQLRAFRRHEQQERLLRGWGTWYAWLSDKYWHLSEKLQKAAQNNSVWSSVTSRLGGDPKGLALGIAEGTIFYKVTYLLHAPLELWLIAQLFRRHRGVLRAEGPTESEADVDVTGGMDEAGETALLVDPRAPGGLLANFFLAMRAARDGEDLPAHHPDSTRLWRRWPSIPW